MRVENMKMKRFLEQRGIKCTPKYLSEGSMKGCWRLYGDGRWTSDLVEKLTQLGFVDFDHNPLDEFSGNGGDFSVFVRGHDELVSDKTFFLKRRV